VTLNRRRATRRPKRASTGPGEETQMLLFHRAGARCELCATDLSAGAPSSKHHRRPRGMGGSSTTWINDVSNLLLLCGTGTTGCHGRIESHRTAAYDAGWLLRTGFNPWEVPVVLHGHRTVYLTRDGQYAVGAP